MNAIHRRGPIVWLCAALLLLGLASLVLRGEVRGRKERRAAPSPAIQARAAPEDGARAPLLAPDDAPAPSESVRAPLLPSGAAEGAAGAEAGPRRALRVLEAASLRPVAGAEVWVLAAERAFDPLGFESVREGGAPLRTDAGGALGLPCAEASVVVARAEGLLGALSLGACAGDEEPAQLLLHPDWDVEVEVLHADGRPAAAVPLRLSLPRRNATARTDDTGRARFLHVGGALALERAMSAAVQVALPLEPARSASVESEPAGPLRFQLPPLASLEVTVLDPERAPVPDGTELELGLVRPGEARDISPFSSERRARTRAVTSLGRALFEHVEPGHEVELLVHLPGTVEERRAYFPGPARADERLEHTVHLGDDRPVLEFRVLEAPGTPLAEAPLALHLLLRSGFMRNEDRPEARTDAEGRFRLELPGHFDKGDRRRLHVGAREGRLTASVDLSQVFPPGLVPMGDLLLGPPPRVVSGRVLDGAGAGVAGARIDLELAVTDDEEGRDFWYWQRHEDELESAADGSFALHAEVEARRLRLRARLEDLQSEHVLVDRGASGVTLVLQQTGALAGSLLLDPALPVEELELTLAPVEGEASGAESEGDFEYRDQIQNDGTFRLSKLLPGRYAFSIRVHNTRPLVEVAGVEIVGGEECRDPRLQALDLRGRIFVRHLTLVFPEPVARIQGNLEHWPPSDPRDRRDSWFDENPLAVVTDLARFDGQLSVPGYRPVRLEGVEGDREILLQSALAVRLVLPAGIPLPAPPVYVKAALAPEDDEGQLDWGAEVFDERREIRCRASVPGRMRVVWLYEQRSGGGAMATTLEGLPEQVVEVLDVGYEQRFELEVDPEALAKALAKAR